jgi:hypothetical protein
MEALLTPLRVQKAGNAAEEYEDAFYPADHGTHDGAELRFAVADGASEGMLSGAWASILVKLHGQFDWTEGSAEEFLDRAYGDWRTFRSEYLRDRDQRNRPVQWYEEPGLREGAFSTFLGLTLTAAVPNHGGNWTAVALGDSCLFHIRAGAVVKTFPLEQSAEFNNHPVLFATTPARNGQALGAIRRGSGTFESGDVFYLMTDALARWSLQEEEEGRAPWSQLKNVVTRGDPPFEGWIDGLRQTKRLRNDDVTLIRIDLVGPARGSAAPFHPIRMPPAAGP